MNAAVSINLAALPSNTLNAMRAAGAELLSCRAALVKGGLNVVGEVLKGQGEFVEFDHYPADDVYDSDSHAQYYYHAHRGNEAEHGHFHLFLRPPGMPAECRPLNYPDATDPWPTGEAALSHLVGVSMDAWGEPIGLFCTNRWVTAEAWYPAEQVIRMLDHFYIDHAAPNWAVNRWITALVRLYRPHIEALLLQRDAVVADWQQAHPGKDVFEDRALDLTGYLPVAVPALIDQLQTLEST